METEIIKTENKELDKIVTESGLILNEAEEIKQSYLPFFARIAEIKEQASKINRENPTALDEKIARELRLKTVKIRTESEEVKNSRKKIHMLKADVEQTSWNLIKSTCQLDEELFAQVEKARERKEMVRKAALKITREAELAPYEVDVQFVDLANMPEESYVKFLESAKISQAQRIESEKKAEEEKRAKEKAEAEERSRIQKENEALKKEAEAREKAMAEERVKAESERIKAEQLAAKEKAKIESEKKAIEERATKERLQLEKAAAKLKEEQEAKLKIAREEKAKIEAELRARKDAEEKARQEAVLKAEEELNKGDKEKFKSLMSDLEMLKYKYTFTGAKYKKLHSQINELLDKTINFGMSK